MTTLEMLKDFKSKNPKIVNTFYIYILTLKETRGINNASDISKYLDGNNGLFDKVEKIFILLKECLITLPLYDEAIHYVENVNTGASNRQCLHYFYETQSTGLKLQFIDRNTNRTYNIDLSNTSLTGTNNEETFKTQNPAILQFYQSGEQSLSFVLPNSAVQNKWNEHFGNISVYSGVSIKKLIDFFNDIYKNFSTVFANEDISDKVKNEITETYKLTHPNLSSTAVSEECEKIFKQYVTNKSNAHNKFKNSVKNLNELGDSTALETNIIEYIFYSKVLMRISNYLGITNDLKKYSEAKVGASIENSEQANYQKNLAEFDSNSTFKNNLNKLKSFETSLINEPFICVNAYSMAEDNNSYLVSKQGSDYDYEEDLINICNRIIKDVLLRNDWKDNVVKITKSKFDVNISKKQINYTTLYNILQDDDIKTLIKPALNLNNDINVLDLNQILIGIWKNVNNQNMISSLLGIYGGEGEDDEEIENNFELNDLSNLENIGDVIVRIKTRIDKYVEQLNDKPVTNTEILDIITKSCNDETDYIEQILGEIRNYMYVAIVNDSKIINYCNQKCYTINNLTREQYEDIYTAFSEKLDKDNEISGLKVLEKLNRFENDSKIVIEILNCIKNNTTNSNLNILKDYTSGNVTIKDTTEKDAEDEVSYNDQKVELPPEEAAKLTDIKVKYASYLEIYNNTYKKYINNYVNINKNNNIIALIIQTYNDKGENIIKEEINNRIMQTSSLPSIDATPAPMVDEN